MQAIYSASTAKSKTRERLMRLLVLIPAAYLILLAGQPAGLDLVKIWNTIVNDPAILLQQLINGLANGAIIVIIALGYTLVYGIIELVNFAHGDVFMLGTFTALLSLSPFIVLTPTGGQTVPWWAILICFIPPMIFCASLNVFIERFAYRPLRNAPKIIVLISAIGMSFILQNVGLQLASLGKLTQVGPEFSVFRVLGTNNAAPKSFPAMLNNDNLLDYIFPPPAAATVPAGVQNQGDISPDDIAATADASIMATMDAQATLDAQITPDSEDVTPDVSDAAVAGALMAEEATPESPEPTLEPTLAAQETEVMATVYAQETEIAATTIAEGGEVVPAIIDGEGMPTEEPTPDIIATMQAETGENPLGDTAATIGADGQSVTNQQKTRVRITIKDVLVIVVAVVLMLALRWFVKNTRLGKAMRATAQNRDAAAIMGINIDRIIALTFAIGGMLAGAAGMMTGIYNGSAVFTMGFTAGLRSFTAAVLGGIGNITGAALGGIIIGVLAAFSDQFLSVQWTNAWVFLVLVLVMLFRPTGLLGQEGGEKA
jgi:branched-subunit amino acid ABC-type transport system permease component